MSRIGRTAVPLPSGVTLKSEGGSVEVQGPKGTLKRELPKGIRLRTEGDKLHVEAESRALSMSQGTTRSHVQNMIRGVTEGFEMSLEMQGVGFRATVKGKNLVLTVGLTHPVEFPVPQGVEIKVDEKINKIFVTGMDKTQVGETASRIRRVKPPEPYKGYGIRRTGERVRRKQGKAGLAKGATK